MNLRLVLYVLGALCLLSSAAMLPSLGIALTETNLPTVGWRTTVAFGGTLVASLLLGVILLVWNRKQRQAPFAASEGFAIVTLGWLLFTVLSGLAMWGSVHHAPLPAAGESVLGCSPGPRFGFVDGLFESMSGFTTTGASVFGTARSAPSGRGCIEALPKSFLFWRSLTHWLGGMGIIVLCLALLPLLRAGGIQMFQAEVPGPSADRLMPRVRKTAAILWGVYVLLSMAQTVLLFAGGMPLFDSLCHTFGTMATGGFSTKDASIGHYARIGHPSALWFELVIALFMFLAGCNFLLHFQALRGNLKAHVRNDEFRFYCLVLGGAIVVVTLFLVLGYPAVSWTGGLRQATFQVLSITTTTGYSTADFDLWPAFCRALLLALMFMGGCAGSTGGGLKQVRVLVVFSYVSRAISSLLRPGLVHRLRIDGVTMREKLVANIVALALLWGLVFVMATGALLLLLPPLPTGAGASDGRLVTASSAVAACLNNIGPGLANVGATCNYGWMPASAKLLLCFCMLIGRLELYAVVVCLTPMVWRD